MAQSVEYPTLDLSSGLDLVRSGCTVGLCAGHGAYERKRERERERERERTWLMDEIQPGKNVSKRGSLLYTLIVTMAGQAHREKWEGLGARR